ncbi:hypothetical protein C9994_17360 [Marivirga lumbricoides]|uniref:Uncharacterized protein n=1 Tax=Marivirga lumbricoides TaxID=1046115 RepID=A0A2T4D9I5_9BACT|nr:hypothetical protein C9994_17360 [Marivirga lumbricoides]
MAESVFGVFFGDEWQEAGVFASWLVLGLVVQMAYSPLSMVLVITEYQFANLLVHSFILFLKVSAMYFSYALGSHMIAVQLLSLSLVLGYGAGIFVILFRARDVSGVVHAKA